MSKLYIWNIPSKYAFNISVNPHLTRTARLFFGLTLLRGFVSSVGLQRREASARQTYANQAPATGNCRALVVGRHAALLHARALALCASGTLQAVHTAASHFFGDGCHTHGRGRLGRSPPCSIDMRNRVRCAAWVLVGRAGMDERRQGRHSGGVLERATHVGAHGGQVCVCVLAT